MRLVVVGRDWGWQEAAQGRPFVGPSGKLLTKAMALAGIECDASDVLITNVVNKRPKGDEWGAHSASDVVEGLDKLQQTLTLAKPDLIVALGEHALQAVTRGDPGAKPPKKHTITETRGYVFESPYGPTLAMVHPAFILRTWHPWWATFCYDWQKAARLLKHPPEAGCPPTEDAWTSASQIAEFYARAPRAVLAVDIETQGTGASCTPVCIAFSWDASIGYACTWDAANLAGIRELLESDVPKLFHNGQFDVTILERAGAPVARWEHDTMLLWHAVEPLLAGKQSDTGSRSEKSLRFLASLLLDEPWWKNYAFETEEERLLLCARDARITLAVHAALSTRLQGGSAGARGGTSGESHDASASASAPRAPAHEGAALGAAIG